MAAYSIPVLEICGHKRHPTSAEMHMKENQIVTTLTIKKFAGAKPEMNLREATDLMSVKYTQISHPL